LADTTISNPHCRRAARDLLPPSLRGEYGLSFVRCVDGRPHFASYQRREGPTGAFDLLLRGGGALMLFSDWSFPPNSDEDVARLLKGNPCRVQSTHRHVDETHYHIGCDGQSLEDLFLVVRRLHRGSADE
jgi:hypothetical protein